MPQPYYACVSLKKNGKRKGGYIAHCISVLIMGVIPGNSELLVLFKTGGVMIRERVYSNSSGSKSRSLRNTLNQTYYQSTWNQLRENETYVVIAHPKHIVGSRRLVFVLLLVFNLLFSCVLNKTTPCSFKPATGVPQVWDKLQRWELCPFIFPHFYEPMNHPTASLEEWFSCKQRIRWWWYNTTTTKNHVEYDKRKIILKHELRTFSACILILIFRKSLMGPQYLLHSDPLQRKVCSMTMYQSTRTDWASQKTTLCLSATQRSVMKRDLCAC